MTFGDPECSLTDLPASMCACPLHRGGDLPGHEQVLRLSVPFPAMFPGVCVDCGDRFYPGEFIAHAGPDFGGYAHAPTCERR